MEFNRSDEIYDKKFDARVPKDPGEELPLAHLTLSQEVYDDETGQWVPEDPEAELLALALSSAPFSESEAFALCTDAILNGGDPGELDALLDKCPPLADFLNASRIDFPIPDFWGYLGLVELASYLGRTKLLDVLLHRGGNVNVRPTAHTLPMSPLEAAAWGGSLGCVERLLAEPTLDLSFSVNLQRLWARLGLEEGQRRCLQRIAPQVTGMEFPDQGPVPIPETFFPIAAIDQANEELFLRLCRERGKLTPTEAEPALGMLWTQASLLDRRDPPDMLLALLELFPEALERQEGRALLALNAVRFPQEARLEPWLKRLRNKPIPLDLLDEHFAGWERDGINTRRLRERLGIA